MSTQKPECMLHRDGYDCDGQSEVLLVIYEDNTYDLFCRQCIEQDQKGSKALLSAKVYAIGSQVKI